MNPLSQPSPEPTSPVTPPSLPPIPENTIYAGTLADYAGDIKGYALSPEMSDWNHGHRVTITWSGMADHPDSDSAKWHVCLPVTDKLSPPPIDAHVACADVSEPAQTNNNACPAGLAKLDDHGRGGFIVEGGYCADMQGRKRGPVLASEDPNSIYVWEIRDAHGTHTFTKEGYWVDEYESSDFDLVAPWIDWKAECDRKDIALRLIKEGVAKILKTRWGHDGDCGVDLIASDLDDICDHALVNLDAATLKGEGGRA